MELRNILAATDFSDNAQRAVERAALLARQHGATLHLAHVIPTISWTMFGRALVEHPLITEKHFYDAAHDRLERVAQDCRTRFGVQVDCHVEIGRADEKISALASRYPVDLTVLGPHDEHFPRNLFVGSTARRYLHHTRHAALVSRSEAASPYARLLVAVDFSDTARRALQAAVAIAPDAEIHAMHVYELLFEGKMRYAGVEQNVIDQYRDAAAAEARQQMHAFLQELGLGTRVQTTVQGGYPAQALLEQAQRIGADLLVMGRRGRSELDELFLGSVTENVLLDLDRDLLLVST
ncbi:MAG TPA: universal stress protein [Noviherbaspirillum sp.]|nr:universal stress protein [Noviherbaspirillum sp.]